MPKEQSLIMGSGFQSYRSMFVCLFVCLNDLPIKGTLQTPTKGYKHQLATANLSHSNIGFTQEIEI